MSSDPKFSIKINDIVGKTWLASLDDSEGYILSFKLIEQNISSPVSPPTKQEKTTVTKTSSQNTNEHSDDDLSTKRHAIYAELKDYFIENSTEFSLFVKKLNIHLAQHSIKPIQYGEKDKVIYDKINRIVVTLGSSEREHSILRNFFESYKNNNDH